MGLFDRFKKPPRVSLEQLSYGIAYKVFPAYAFEQPKVLLDVFESSPDSAHALLYELAAFLAAVDSHLAQTNRKES